MNLFEYINLATRALWGNKLRSILTILIIAFGIMALIIIFTCISAIRNNIAANFVELGAAAFTIQHEQDIQQRRHSFQEEKTIITYNEANSFIEKYNYPANSTIHAEIAKNIRIKSAFTESDPNVTIDAGDINYLAIAGKEILMGRNFTEIEIENGENVLIMGYDAAAKTYPAADSVVGSKILADGKKYQVIGLLASKGASAGKNDNFVLIPYSKARKDYDISNTSFEIIVEANNTEKIEQAMAVAEGVMRSVKKLGALEPNNFGIVKSDKLASTYLEQISFIEIATAVIGFLTLIGAGVGLMNIMLVSVNERTREIGLSKSIGATKRTIFMQFLIEAIVICISGGILGIVLGLIIGNLISIFVLKASFTFAIAWVIGGLLFCTLIGLVAGLFPAYRAGKLNPVEALRYE